MRKNVLSIQKIVLRSAMSQAKPNSRVLWVLLPVMVCVFAVLLETPAIMAVPLGIAALLAAGFGTKLFHKLSERSPFFLVFLGGVTGVTSLYFGTIFVSLSWL